MPDETPGTLTARLFAVVPAAGRSRRMGRPKLLLPWGDHTVIEQVLIVLHQAGCTATTVVVRPDDNQLAEILSVCEAGCDVVVPEVAPADMRASVQHALNHVEQTYHPTPRDAWLLVPADHPTVRPEWISVLRDAHDAVPDAVCVPTYAGRRGHPVLFPWRLAEAVACLPAESGINQLLRNDAVTIHPVPISDAAILTDLDTPQDYQRQQSHPG